MASCRYQSLKNIQPNVQWVVVPHPCAGITDSSTAAFTFIHIDTHSADPHALPECMYIKRGQNRKDNLSLSLERPQLSHEGFPPAVKFTSSFFKAQYNSWNIHIQWQFFFLPKLTQACSRELTENLFYCTSLEAEMLCKFPHRYFTLHSAHSIPFPSPTVTTQHKNVFTFKLSGHWFQ